MKSQTCSGSESLEPDCLQSIPPDELMGMILTILERNKNAWFLSWIYVRAKNLEKIIHN